MTLPRRNCLCPLARLSLVLKLFSMLNYGKLFAFATIISLPEPQPGLESPSRGGLWEAKGAILRPRRDMETFYDLFGPAWQRVERAERRLGKSVERDEIANGISPHFTQVNPAQSEKTSGERGESDSPSISRGSDNNSKCL